MPRKTAKKVAASKESDVKVVEQEATPRRSGRASKGDDPERSRRSSTVAQTVVSVADSKESKVTKGRSSPSEGRRSSSRKVATESPSRIRSARRSTGKINYKESDGEEEVSTPKNEENFDSNEDYEDSDSDETAKEKEKKAPKSPPKGRNVKQKAKTPAKTSSRSRGRPNKKKSETIEISDDEIATHELSDDAGEEKKKKTASKGTEDESKSSRKRPAKSAAEPVEKPTSARSRAARAKPEPATKRSSRNKQVKKYTELDEDFSDAKSEEEQEEIDLEPEEKKEPSKKRKREKADEVPSAKKLKRGKSSEDKSEEPEEIEEVKEQTGKSKKEETPTKKNTDDAKDSKTEDVEDIDSEYEPMEIDEGDSNPPAEDKKKDDSKTPKNESDESDEDIDEDEPVPSKKEGGDKKTLDQSAIIESKNSTDPEVKEESKKDFEEKIRSSSMPKDEADDTQHSKTSSQYSDEVEDSGEEDSEEMAEKEVISKSEQSKLGEAIAVKAAAAVNCIDSKSENTFPQKETSESSVNGDKKQLGSVTVPPVVSDGPQSRNELPVKENGSHEENDSLPQPGNYPALRRYVVNPSMTEDTRSSLKEKMFGVASYNLRGAEHTNKDKLIQELSKLQASVICLQDVSKDLYDDVLESNMDVLGFKGVGSWSKEARCIGLATFYKTSVFRLTKSTEISLQKLVEQELETTNLDDSHMETLRRNLNKCGHVLFVQLSTVLGDRHLNIGNVAIPAGSISLNTMQVSGLSQELVNISKEIAKPILLCGELNIIENKVPYQLLRHGCLTEGMLEELKSRTESPSEIAAFESFLKKASLRPSCKMSSCYATVLGKELLMPRTKVTSSSLVWFTPDSLHTIGVLDVSPEFSDNTSDHPVSLKADVAFCV